MSLITDVLLVSPYDEPEALNRLQQWLEQDDDVRHQVLKPIDMSYAGGRKFFTSRVYAMAANYMHSIEFIEAWPTFGFGPDGVCWVQMEGEDAVVLRGTEPHDWDAKR